MGLLIICILVIFVSLCIIMAITDSQQTEAENNKKKLFEEIRSVCKEYNITFVEPIGELTSSGEYRGYTYKYINEVSLVNQKELTYYYWIDKEKNNLCFVGRKTAYTIPIANIEMYTTDGTIKYNSIIKNNEKNISLSGAIVGNMIAGTPGMIIGATKDRHNIETKIDENDERKIYIYYRYKNNDIESLTVEKSFFNAPFLFDSFLEKELPNKSEKYILANQTIENNIIKNNTANKTSNQVLKELKQLYEDGLISEDDYNQKKKDVLNNMI